MVGKKIGLAKLTSKYVGRMFSDCSCMTLIHSWYSDMGVAFPDSYEDLTIENYLEAWEKDKKRVIKKMLEFFKTLGQPVKDLDNLKQHELLAVSEKTNQGDTGNIYAAIYLSNSMAITSNFHDGVRVFHLGRLHEVIMARRLIVCN